MKSRSLSLSTILLALITLSNRGLSQNLASDSSFRPNRASQAFSSSISTSGVAANTNSAAAAVAFVRLAPNSAVASKSFRPFSQVGFASHTGLGGAGFDIATPLARNFNIRAGSDFFNYSTTFQQQGANIAVTLHMLSGHASLDWFPFGGRFRLSPQIVFGNNNRILATALIPSGSNITLNGQNYISSLTDPLQGSGSIGFRKVSPGFTFGFGNIIPRTKGHVSLPVEAGFYYAGQPALKVNFSGSGCDPTQPPSIGCQSVVLDANFQQNLAAFTARTNHNLSYASFFPIFSVGFGYAF